MKALVAFLFFSLAACASTPTSPPVTTAAEEACAYEVADVGGTPTDPNPNEMRRSKDRTVLVGCR